jgi:hypothetical protein
MTTRRTRQPLRQPASSPARRPAEEVVTSVSKNVDWHKILRAAAIGAIATSVAQVIGAPLDVAHRMARASNGSPSVPRALVQCVRAAKLLDGLPLHLVKRVPTKCLTVGLFEFVTQAVQSRRGCAPGQSLSGREHLAVAASSGTLALVATYPLHLGYYALRKGVPHTVLLQALQYPRHLYAGIIPAVMSVLPAVAVEYSVYKSIRSHVTHLNALKRCGLGRCESSLYASATGRAMPSTDSVGPAPTATRTRVDMLAVVLAAAVASSLAGALSEPLKAVSRRMAVDSVRTLKSQGPTIVGTVRDLVIISGPGEFWRGFRTRSLRYALSAATAKLTVEKLKGAPRSAFPAFKARSPHNDALQMCPLS